MPLIKIKNNLFVLSINEKYFHCFQSILDRNTIIFSRQGVQDNIIHKEFCNNEIINFNFNNYSFKNLINFNKFKLYNILYIPCYDVNNIPLSFDDIKYFGALFAKKIIFIDINQNQLVLSKLVLIRQLIKSKNKKCIGTISNLYKDFTIINPLKIIKMYKNCFFSTNSSEAEGFCNIWPPVVSWYKTRGREIQRNGCWGYSFESSFGTSLKEDFYRTTITYKLQYLLLGFWKSTVLAIILFFIPIIVISFIKGNLFLGILVSVLVLFSRYFQYCFVKMVKPENIGWFVPIILLYCTINGYYYLLSMGLLILAFINFSVTILTLPLIFSFFTANISDFFLYTSPSLFKICFDLYIANREEYVRRILNMISGRFIKGDKRAYDFRNKEYNILQRNIEYRIILYITVFHVIMAWIFNDLFVSLWGMFLLVYLFNFLCIRINDQDSFIRYYLILIIITIIMSKNLNWISLSILFLSTVIFQKDEQLKPYVVSADLKDQIQELLSKNVDKNNRILFEYSGHLYGNKFRGLMCYLEYIFYEHKISFIPNEQTAYFNSCWLFDKSKYLSMNSSYNQLEDMLQKCGINFLLIFSKELKEKLKKMNFELLGEITLSQYDVKLFGDININSLFLFKTSNYHPIIIPNIKESNINFEIKNNFIQINNVNPREEYIICYKYHKDWQAHQGDIQLKVEKICQMNISFMKIIAINNEPIKMKFGKVNYYIR